MKMEKISGVMMHFKGTEMALSLVCITEMAMQEMHTSSIALKRGIMPGRGFDCNDNKVPMSIVDNISYENDNSGFKFLFAKHRLVGNIRIGGREII